MLGSERVVVLGAYSVRGLMRSPANSGSLPLNRSVTVEPRHPHVSLGRLSMTRRLPSLHHCNDRPPPTAARAQADHRSAGADPGLANAIHLAGRVPLSDRLALVVGALAPRHRQLDLDELLLEIQAQRHQGEASLGDAV